MTQRHLHEVFDKPVLHPLLRWHCEPANWSVDPVRRSLRVKPTPGTDFWQRTHYGFEADNGHFLFTEVPGDLVLSTHVRFHPVHQYDQAGLMVRVSSACWLKTSVEFEPDEPSRLGAVVTNQSYSDWSMQAFPAHRSDSWLRIRRLGSDYIVEASGDGRQWEQIRVAHLHEDRAGGTIDCGLYACSPKGVGFVAEFDFLHIDTGSIP